MNKNNNKGCFSGILGTLLVILGVVVYAVFASFVSKLFIASRFGEDAACALLTLSLTGMGVAFVLYEVIFIMWQIKLSKITAQRDGDGRKFNTIFRIVTVVCICLSLLFSVISANTFVECREDSISKVCFVTTKEYRWDDRCDVLRYTFSCDANGGLTYNITMKDGEVVALLGTVSSVSNSFKEKYETDTMNFLKYAAELSEQFDRSDFIIEKKIIGAEYMKKFYKIEGSELWACIERIISDPVE